MAEKQIFIRYDEGRNEYVISLVVPGATDLEASGTLLSEAFQNMAEQLEGEGL